MVNTGPDRNHVIVIIAPFDCVREYKRGTFSYLELNLNYRESECVMVDKALKEMNENYDNVCRHRLQLERDIKAITHEKNMVCKQLTDTQVCWSSWKYCNRLNFIAGKNWVYRCSHPLPRVTIFSSRPTQLSLFT